MLAPLSWLKEYIDIKLEPKILGNRLTEIGLGTEKIIKEGDDVIFELEITPNRPDLLSIIGIAREIAAVENKKIKYPKAKTDLKPKRETLPLEIITDFSINPRFSGIIIKGVKVKESPKWLKERLLKIGQRPINNIVDATNYVMFELGNPIHAFDYDKVLEHYMEAKQTKGGEIFESVDDIKYRLPKGAVVIYDKEKIIDLCGIKGGKNTGTFHDTKNIFIRVPVENPILIRRSSQAIGLRSEASSIFERGVNAGGTIDALKRTVDLIQEIAGGEIASNLYDLKKTNFNPWKLNLRLERLNKILGLRIPEQKVFQILQRLNLHPVSLKEVKVIETTIPTYRNDLKIEEDLIEEVARIYGYNNFPKTIPMGQTPTTVIPYFKDYRLEEKVKNILKATGFSEIYTYGLISEEDLAKAGFKAEKVLRVDNPVSKEYEYLRPTLKIGITKALLQNKPNFSEINLFELGKVYLGKTLAEAKEEYFLSGISNKKNFYEIKGILERLLEEIGIKHDPAEYIEITNEGIIFELNFSQKLKKVNLQKKFVPIPRYPPIIEDLAIVVDKTVKTGEIIKTIQKQNPLIIAVDLLDQYEDTRTFHIVYQHKERNLKSEEVKEIRDRVLKTLKEKFEAEVKE